MAKFKITILGNKARRDITTAATTTAISPLESMGKLPYLALNSVVNIPASTMSRGTK